MKLVYPPQPLGAGQGLCRGLDDAGIFFFLLHYKSISNTPGRDLRDHLSHGSQKPGGISWGQPDAVDLARGLMYF